MYSFEVRSDIQENGDSWFLIANVPGLSFMEAV